MSDAALRHINYLEMVLFLLAIQQFQKILSDQTVFVKTDTTTVMTFINKQGGGGVHSPSLCVLV